MGRWNTGAITTEQCLELNISTIKDNLKVQKEDTGSICWSTGATIGYRIVNTGTDAILHLDYFKKDRNGEKNDMKYSISIISTPSNLGMGCIYYFVCPFSGKRCKILYMGYGSLYFKSREAYSHRIYYASQLSSYLDKHNDKYWSLERKLNKISKKRRKTHYRGKETSIQKKITKIQNRRDYRDSMRWNVFPKALLKSIGLKGITEISDLL